MQRTATKEFRCVLEDRIKRCSTFLKQVEPEIKNLEKREVRAGSKLLELIGLRNDLMILKREAGERLDDALTLELGERDAALVNAATETAFQNHQAQVERLQRESEFNQARRWILQSLDCRKLALKERGFLK